MWEHRTLIGQFESVFAQSTATGPSTATWTMKRVFGALLRPLKGKKPLLPPLTERALEGVGVTRQSMPKTLILISFCQVFGCVGGGGERMCIVMSVSCVCEVSGETLGLTVGWGLLLPDSLRLFLYLVLL